MNRFEGLVNAVKDNSNSPAGHRQWLQYFASLKGFPSFSAFTDIVSVFFHDEGLRANHSDIILRNIAKAVAQFGAGRVKAFLVTSTGSWKKENCVKVNLHGVSIFQPA